MYIDGLPNKPNLIFCALQIEPDNVLNYLGREEERFGGFVQTPNVRIHYLDRGPQTGIRLIWANGTYSNAHELDLVSDSLLSAGLRLITIDCCGHGLTPRGDHPVSIYHVADDMAFLLDHLGITKLTGVPLSSSASA